jgi:hypothetical protein
MVFKTTFIDSGRQRAFTILETMLATGLSSLIFAMVASSFLFQIKSYYGLSNYVDLDRKSRNALDLMSKQIRRAHWLSDYGTNFLAFEDADETPLRFTFDPVARTLIRTKNGVDDPKPLLTECDFLQFSIFQRNPVGGSYDQYPTAASTNCKLVQMSWICSRKIMGTTKNTESVQSAKIVIRRR